MFKSFQSATSLGTSSLFLLTYFPKDIERLESSTPRKSVFIGLFHDHGKLVT